MQEVYKKIAVIGVGNMGSAMLRAWLEKKTLLPEDLLLFDIKRDRLLEFKDLEIADSIEACANKADILFLCIKPQQMQTALDSLGKDVGDKSVKALVSIAAGLKIEYFKKQLPHWKIVRMMPNTPLQVKEGAVGVSYDLSCPAALKARLTGLFAPLGETVEVEETQMDAITALSGSGPGFIFELIDAMATAGVKEGLSWEVAKLLTAQTVRGAGTMVLASKLHPRELKEKVSSPGGTTLAGLEAMEQNGFRDAIQSAIMAAAERSRKLSE